jgi:Immunity protein Imm6
MHISVEQFLDSVTLRAKAAFVIVLGEKTIEILQDDSNTYALARNLLDHSWLWEESLSVSPFEIHEYLESSSEDPVEQEKLSLVCQFSRKTPEPTLTAIMTSINAGCLTVKYAFEVLDGDRSCIPDIIVETHELDFIPNSVEDIINHHLIDKVWIEKAMSYLMENYGTGNPNSLGKPIKREELMNLK